MGRFYLLLAVGLIFDFSAASASQSFTDISKALLAKAELEVEGQSYESAQRLYERALVANPASVEALHGLGLVHDRQGRVGRSLKYFRQALEINPRYVPSLTAQAYAFLKRDLPDRALQNADRLREICGETCEEALGITTAVSDYRNRLAAASEAEQG